MLEMDMLTALAAPQFPVILRMWALQHIMSTLSKPPTVTQCQKARAPWPVRLDIKALVGCSVVLVKAHGALMVVHAQQSHVMLKNLTLPVTMSSVLTLLIVIRLLRVRVP